ncbi:MAG TPA: DUF302 domain-containing protein [Gammaproteobacteria bacterium]
MLRKIMILAAFLLTQTVQAANPNVFELSVNKTMAEVYGPLYKALEDDGFFVVFEADIGANLSRFAEKWGENYNRSKLDGIRSMVFCNGWYANAVSNADPTMLALCPLRLSLIEKQGKTSVLFVKPTAIAGDSPARDILQRVENDVTGVIRKTLQVQ